jgi:hypothetical protein
MTKNSEAGFDALKILWTLHLTDAFFYFLLQVLFHETPHILAHITW